VNGKALSYSRLTNPVPAPIVTITIRLKRNGPYVIAAEEASEVVILDADGTRVMPESGRSIALCRCGASSTKPFCDRSHRENGFDGSIRWTDCYPVQNPVDQGSAGPAPSDSK
jgi:CDGSH-type Zn-finger protein